MRLIMHPVRIPLVDSMRLFDFQSFGKSSTLNYGFELNGISTALEFRNFVGVTFEQMENTTELAGYVSWRQKTGPLIIEPGLRAQFYASLGDFSIEPRLALKSNFSDKVRLKFAAGKYSQNLISTVNEKDVVNLFVGFLSGPEETIYEPGIDNNTETKDKLQKAWHFLGGCGIRNVQRMGSQCRRVLQGLFTTHRCQSQQTE